jgi:hydroxymethylglutaryl-CoA reductase
MKMHLLNIANQLGADQKEKKQLVEHFKTDVVTPNAVRSVLQNIRNLDQ